MAETSPPTYLYRPMALRDALAVYRWRYSGEYAIYDLGLVTLLAATFVSAVAGKKAGVAFYAVALDDDPLIGIVSLAYRSQDVELGLGLRPDLTGRGLGLPFVRSVMDLARERYHPRTLSLCVATFNHRAIKIYERAGFVGGATRPTRFHGKPYMELLMSRPADEA